jgi:hypothetical protein
VEGSILRCTLACTLLFSDWCSVHRVFSITQGERSHPVRVYCIGKFQCRIAKCSEIEIELRLQEGVNKRKQLRNLKTRIGIKSKMQQYRDLRSEPDPEEPSYSYEEKSFYLDNSSSLHPDDVEDAFHRRLATHHHRRDNMGTSTGGSSFWRNTSTSSTNESDAPPAVAVDLDTIQIKSSANRGKDGPSMLSVALQEQNMPRPQQYAGTNNNATKNLNAPTNGNTSGHQQLYMVC